MHTDHRDEEVHEHDERRRLVLMSGSDERSGAGALPSSAPARARVFAGHDFPLLFSAYAFSCVGDSLALVALTIRVHDITGSGWAVSAVLLSGLVPMLVLAPLAGRVLDGYETVGVLRFVALVEVGVAAALAFSSGLVVLLSLAFVLGAGFAVNHPGLFALVPDIVGEEGIAEANGYLELARWGGAVLGPLLAGVLAAGAGTRAALLADAATFLVMAGAMACLHVRRTPIGTMTAGPGPRARDGLSVLTQDPILRLVVAAVLALVLTSSAVNVAEVFFAKEVLHAGDFGYAALVAAWGAGVAVAVGLLARRLPMERLGAVVLAAVAAVGVAYLAAAAATHLFATEVAFFGGGMANGLGLVAVRTLLHRQAPSCARGRVFAAYGGLVTAAQLPSLVVGGIVVQSVGPRVTLLVGGVSGLAVAAIGAAVYALSQNTLAERPAVS
jgi:MFS family permease